MQALADLEEDERPDNGAVEIQSESPMHVNFLKFEYIAVKA